MTPARHPSDATLFDYGGGSLAEPLALAVVTHVAICPLCRDRLAAIEAIGGAMLDDLEPEALAPAAFAATVARLDSAPPPEPEPVPDPTPAAAILGIPFVASPLAAYLGGIGEMSWRRLGRGIAAMDLVLRPDRAARATLFRVSRGTPLPLHGHRGREMTVVLEGSFHDETGHYRPGDFIEHDRDVIHRPAVTDDEDCVCLIAMEGRLKFKGVFGRLIPLFVDL